ncbi:hypothetical protein [Lysinibacillus capsici]|uniref:hypothetical protein n=1 Tax=Lysinibacillus capsici TaxID=2115968 RepID=UPI003D722CDB
MHIKVKHPLGEYILDNQIFKFEGELKNRLLGKAEEFTKQTYDFSEHERKTKFINCWHLNDFESAAMWDLYLKSNEGIAIQTTFDRLKRSLNRSKEEIYMGKVKYIDYRTERNFHRNTLSPFFTKRISFSHENDVRLLYSNNKDFNKDIWEKHQSRPCGIN